MTVFIVAPRYVFLKIGCQPLGCAESVRVLSSTKMAVIPFSHLVVVAHHADGFDNISQLVLELVCRAHKRFWNPQQDSKTKFLVFDTQYLVRQKLCISRETRRRLRGRSVSNIVSGTLKNLEFSHVIFVKFDPDACCAPNKSVV